MAVWLRGVKEKLWPESQRDTSKGFFLALASGVCVCGRVEGKLRKIKHRWKL